MDGLLNWVGNILFFLVFITVVENLLPGKNYNRYIRLSAGMVLILLVLKPVMGGLHLEQQINRYFESFTFQQDAKDLSKEILGIEQKRLEQIIDSYEQVVENDVNIMAEEMGLVPVQTRAIIERSRESGNYGSVIFIKMQVKCEGEEDKGTEDKNDAIQAVNPVEPVTVRVKEAGEETEGPEAEKDSQWISWEGTLEQFRRKVEGYYGLQAGQVEIKFQGRQR